MSNTTKSYDFANIKRLEKSVVEIKTSVSAEKWEKFRARALKIVNESINIDGFRKGMVPENILIGKIGEIAILEKMAEISISKAYSEIIFDNKIDTIGKPNIQLTKLAKNNPLEFKITLEVMPEVKLPDYKRIAFEEVARSSSEEKKVTDKDLEEAIISIQKSKTSHYGHDHSKLTPEEHEKEIEKNMPKLTDDFVKTLGNFSGVSDFKEKLLKILVEKKKETAREKRRIKMIELISDASNLELPDIIVEEELRRIEIQFKDDIEKMGLKMDDYLRHIKKGIDEIRKEWRVQAEKKAKSQLILNVISIKENIKPDQKEVETEIKHILEHYKDAKLEQVTVYAETVLTNDKVFKWLESQV